MLVAVLAALAIPMPVPPAISHTIATTPVAAEVRFTLAPTGNEARYRVREQLAGLDFPNDAIGKTSDVTGTLVFDDNGQVVAEQSKIVIGLKTLASDKERRDGYVQRRTLVTDSFPTAEFTVRSVSRLDWPLPTSGALQFTITGDLTIKGVTRSTTWQVMANATPASYRGTASTRFTFEDFGLSKPRVASVLSVDDNIALEFDFNFVRM